MTMDAIARTINSSVDKISAEVRRRLRFNFFRLLDAFLVEDEHSLQTRLWNN